MTWASATPSVATITTAGLATGWRRVRDDHGDAERCERLDGTDGDGGLVVVDRRDAGEPEPREGLTQQFTATGTYTDNSTQNLTSQVTWASGTPSVATITTGRSGHQRGDGHVDDLGDAERSDRARRC